jgi:hypothetical protein
MLLAHVELMFSTLATFKIDPLRRSAMLLALTFATGATLTRTHKSVP